MSTNRTTTATFIHATPGECELIHSTEPGREGFSTSTTVHLAADSIGRTMDHLDPNTPREAAEYIDDPAAIVVQLGSAAQLILDPATARALAKYLNAAARVAERNAAKVSA